MSVHHQNSRWASKQQLTETEIIAKTKLARDLKGLVVLRGNHTSCKIYPSNKCLLCKQKREKYCSCCRAFKPKSSKLNPEQVILRCPLALQEAYVYCNCDSNRFKETKVKEYFKTKKQAVNFWLWVFIGLHDSRLNKENSKKINKTIHKTFRAHVYWHLFYL